MENGADDYITKPFDLREVMARIRLQLNKTNEPVAPDEYHSKTEETMMDLVNETEKNKKKRYQGLWGTVILCIFLIAAGKMIMPKAHQIGAFVNIIDIVIILVTDIVVLLASGYGRDFCNGFRVNKLTKEERIRCVESLELLQKSSIFAALFIGFYAVITILRMLVDASMLGPQCSIAILGLLYAFVINLVLLIPIYRLKRRIDE